MGQLIKQDSFRQEDHEQFRERLQIQLTQLRDLVHAQGFSDGPCSLGAELEMYLVDNNGCPVPKNQQLIDTMQHPQLQEELNRFNLEFNLSPVAASGSPFSAMGTELRALLNALQKVADTEHTRIVPIGILPTLEQQHLGRENMTDLPRYRALTHELATLKGSAFSVYINGQDSVKMESDEVTLEGANTSFQVHLKVPASRFAAMYNAAQLITPLVLALAGNSPIFLGQRLWQETRIALFKQSIDNRTPGLTEWRQPARVSFGQGWIRHSAWELFAENVSLYPPLLPMVFDPPKPFGELCLHHGTVWPWNRAVFEPSGDGHLRIEYRTLPAGPTVRDMLANAALAIGWTVALSHQIEDYLVRLPFAYAEYNFYRSAQQGLAANILWPEMNQHEPHQLPICQVIESLLPLAVRGLQEIDVAEQEISDVMSIIRERLQSRQTGAQWQLRSLEKYRKGHSHQDALHLMLEDYIKHMHGGDPVCGWSV